MTRWVLYGTSACHLCERAEALLRGAGLGFEKIDVAADAALMARYGVRIPVLADRETGRELGWPFDAAALQAFITGEADG